MATKTAVHGLCSNCGKETDLELLAREEIINVRKEPIKIKIEYCKCSKCGDEILDPYLNVDPFRLAYEEYRRKHGFLQPDELTRWRKAYHLTQGELAKLIGIGTATLSRYENGSLQDESHEKLLRLIMQPLNFLSLVEDSENILAPSKKEKLVHSLKETQTEMYSVDGVIMINFGNYEPSEFSGYKKLDLVKLYNTMLFFAKPGVLKTKLNKLLFYADFKYFKEYALSITGAQYAHIPFGPAPDNYEIYYASLHSQRAIESIEQPYSSGYVGEIIKAIKEPELNLFSPSELRIMASVSEDFANFGAGEITEFSHKELGYTETSNGEIISYMFALQLNY